MLYARYESTKIQFQQEASGFAEAVDAAVSSSSAMEAAAKAVAQFLFEEGRLSKNQVCTFDIKGPGKHKVKTL